MKTVMKVAFTCCVLLVASCKPQPAASEIGRFQFAVDSTESGTSLYVMDTVTGQMICRSMHEGHNTWYPVLPTPSLAVFQDVMTKHENDVKITQERKSEIERERKIVAEKFCAGTLVEQIEMAESILVFQCVKRPAHTSYARVVSAATSVTPVPSSGPTGNSFGFPEILKGPRISQVRSKTFYTTGAGTIAWVIRDLNYSNDGIVNSRLYNSLQKVNINEGELLVLFTVSNEQLETHFEFLFAREQLETSEFTTLPFTNEPEDFIAEIKAVLAEEAKE